MRDWKTKIKFIAYMIGHPHERYWQSIRNFAKVDSVLIANGDMVDGVMTIEPGDLKDTFYIESDKGGGL